MQPFHQHPTLHPPYPNLVQVSIRKMPRKVKRWVVPVQSTHEWHHLLLKHLCRRQTMCCTSAIQKASHLLLQDPGILVTSNKQSGPVQKNVCHRCRKHQIKCVQNQLNRPENLGHHELHQQYAIMVRSRPPSPTVVWQLVPIDHFIHWKTWKIHSYIRKLARVLKRSCTSI